ncbi:glycine zipper 2TM domain-containing protein [Ramlibacter rhizophilus]|uniref:Glycine zipper 2TM domain-containing protein n=2 Tax=Ramlibacter rhizophilus TaxID=1781167 RepID=A0A4Z0BL56_9BURK|nr:glycine zipper 2TM domain-containing protein [Ramlibacter rhizophilus]
MAKPLVCSLLLAAGAASAQTYVAPSPAPLPAAAPAPAVAVFSEQARVRSVQPQYELVQVPREECSVQLVTEQVAPPAPASGGIGANGYGGLIVGGVAGALLGNQIGKGHGREAATAAGAVAGALVGDRLAGSGATPAVVAQPMQREVRSCRTVYDQQQRLTGYRVVYDWRGHEGTALTREQPGATIPVRVSVTPELR